MRTEMNNRIKVLLFKKTAVLLITLIFLISCGSQGGGGGGGGSLSEPVEEASANIVLKDKIDIKIVPGEEDLLFVDPPEFYVLGEVINTGSITACKVEITYEVRDAEGYLLKDGFYDIEGNTISGHTYSKGCLLSGEAAGFKIKVNSEREPKDFSYKIDWVNANGIESLEAVSDVVVSSPIVESVDESGRKKLTGFIKNINKNTTVKFPKITFTAKNNSKVVDLSADYVNGSLCLISFELTNEFEIMDVCLDPGDTSPFSVVFDESPSAITDFYYKISYDYYN